MTISKYYKYYLTLHEHPKCKLLHFIGQVVTLLFMATIFLLDQHGIKHKIAMVATMVQTLMEISILVIIIVDTIIILEQGRRA